MKKELDIPKTIIKTWRSICSIWLSSAGGIYELNNIYRAKKEKS